MKKFKTKKYHNNRKLILIFFIIIFFIAFIYFSFQKINKSYNNIVLFLLKDMNKEKNSYSIVKNLDYLVSNYSFDDSLNKIVKNPEIIYIYSTNNDTYHEDLTITDAIHYLQKNLKKLGIKSIVDDKKITNLSLEKMDNVEKDMVNNHNISYYIDIQKALTDKTKITINNKNYTKILFVLEKNNSNYQKIKTIYEKMNDYLNENYPGLSRGILGKNDEIQYLGENNLLIEIGGIDSTKEEVNNSTEIIALMLYNILGDKM